MTEKVPTFEMLSRIVKNLAVLNKGAPSTVTMFLTEHGLTIEGERCVGFMIKTSKIQISFGLLDQATNPEALIMANIERVRESFNSTEDFS